MNFRPGRDDFDAQLQDFLRFCLDKSKDLA